MNVMARSSRWLVLAALLSGCAGLLPIEEHGGLSPKPAKVSDVGFMAIGAGIDVAWEYTGQKLLRHVPLLRHLDGGAIRIGVIDLGADYCVRACSTFGRPVDSGFLMAYGQILANMARFTIYHVKHPSHPNCSISRGPDTAVTVPVRARELSGQMWNGQCLTWDEVRTLRHAW